MPRVGVVYINTELTVHLHRLPDGDWVCLDSHTAVESTGIGLAQSALYDLIGPLGRGAQALLIDRRAPADPGPYPRRLDDRAKMPA